VTLEEKLAVERRLAELTEAGGGSLTPEAVVADAENTSSPLHAHIFRESDREAAHKHRLDLARQLIRSVRVEVTREHKTYSVVGYVHDPGSKAAGYVPTVSLINERERAHALITREFATVEGIVTRSRELAEVLGLKDQYESLLASLQQFVTAHRNAA
jgi:hypothetical protein